MIPIQQVETSIVDILVRGITKVNIMNIHTTNDSNTTGWDLNSRYILVRGII